MDTVLPRAARARVEQLQHPSTAGLTRDTHGRAPAGSLQEGSGARGPPLPRRTRLHTGKEGGQGGVAGWVASSEVGCGGCASMAWGGGSRVEVQGCE